MLKYSDIEIFRYGIIQILKYSYIEIFRYWNTQILKYSDIETYRYWDNGMIQYDSSMLGYRKKWDISDLLLNTVAYRHFQQISTRVLH